MLPKIEVSINNRSLDLGKFDLNLKYFIFDPQDLGARGTAISYNFPIPTSKYNLGVLGVKTSVWDSINNYKVINNVSIIANSDTILVGSLELTSFDNDNIQANFRSDQWDWVKSLEGLKLNELKNYKVPYSYVFSDVDNCSIDAYTQNKDQESHINFPVVPRGYIYKPREINIYTLTAENLRDVPPPDGSYKLVQGQINITVSNGLVQTISRLEEGYYKIEDQNAPYTVYDCEFYIIPDFQNTEFNVMNFEDIVPSFYISSILKKIFIEQNIRVDSSIFYDPLLKDLMMTFQGEEFQWNQERFNSFIGLNPEGRSKLLIDYRYTPSICPGVVDYQWDLLTGFHGIGLCNNTGVQAMPDYETFSNDSQTNRPSPAFTDRFRKRYFILNVKDQVQNMVGNYKNSYVSTELKNRYGHFYRCRKSGEYTFTIKLNYDIYGPQPNNMESTNMIALVKGPLKYNSDNGISESTNANNSGDYPIVGTTTEGFGSGSCLYWKSMQIPNSDLPIAGPIEFTCTVFLEENEEILPVFIGRQDSEASIFNSAYRATNFEMYVKPVEGDWDLDIAKNLPDIGQLDFVKDIMFHFNLYPRYDMVKRKLDFITYDECLALGTLDLSNRSSVIEANQEALVEWKKLELGYQEDKENILIKDYRKLNYIKEDNTKSENYEFKSNFAPGYNFQYKNQVFPMFDSLPGLGFLEISDIYYIANNMLAFMDKDANKTNYYDINWNYGNTPTLGLFIRAAKITDYYSPPSPSLYTADSPMLPLYVGTKFGAYTFNIVTKPGSVDRVLYPYAFGSDYYNIFGRNVNTLVSPDITPMYYIATLSSLHFHPILDFNTTYQKFYRNLVDKNNKGHKVTIKTRLKYTEFKEIVTGGIRKVKWNNDYYLLLEIDKYNLDSEMGELTLLKAIGF